MSSAKKQSIVWQYFTAMPDIDKAKCGICGNFLAYKNSTSSLRNHLSFKHPAINLNKITFPSSQEILTALPSLSNLPVKSEPCNDEDLYVESCEWDSLTNSLVELCASDLLPLSMLQGSGFKAFCRKFDSNCVIPSASTIHNQLSSYYCTVKDALINSYKGHSKLSFSLETWRHSEGQDYSTVWVHFIDSNWVQQNRVLSTYLNDKLKDQFLSSMDRFDISNNTILTVTSPFSEDIVFPVLTCLGSAFEHSINTGFKLTCISKIVKSVSALQSHIEKNPHVMDAFSIKQRQLKLPEKELLKSNPRRWIQTFKMLQRALEQRLAILSIINDRSIICISNARKYEISDEDWSLIEDVCKLLEPFHAATLVLRTEKFPSAGSLYPILTGLLQIHLKMKATDSSEIRSFKECIVSKLNEYYFHDNVNLVTKSAVISSAVDPRFKQLRFLDEKQRLGTWNHIINLLVVIKRSDLRDRKRVKEQTHEIDEPISKRAKTLEFILGDFSDFVDASSELITPPVEDQNELSLPTPSDVREDALEEIERFKLEVCSLELKCPCDWWKAHHRQYPLLSRLALQYLSIPATSTPSERLFSDTEDLLSRRRATLDPETLDQILFVRDVL